VDQHFVALCSGIWSWIPPKGAASSVAFAWKEEECKELQQLLVTCSTHSDIEGLNVPADMLQLFSDNFEAMAISRDSHFIAGCWSDGCGVQKIKILHSDTGKQMNAVSCVGIGNVVDMAFGNDNKLFFGVRKRWNPLEIWCFSDKGVMSRVMAVNNGARIKFSPDASACAIYQGSERVTIWSVESSQKLMSCNNSSDCVAWSPKGRFLAILSSSSTHQRNAKKICVWDTQEEELFIEWNFESPVSYITFCTKASSILSGGKGSITLWKVGRGKNVTKVRELSVADCQSIAVSPDDKYIAASVDNYYWYEVHLWDMSSGERVAKFQKKIPNLLWSPDGSFIAGSSHILRADVKVCHCLWRCFSVSLWLWLTTSLTMMVYI
jgi:hypothetical protein